MSSVLLVDDEPSICWALEQALIEEGHAVTTAASAEEALESMQVSSPDAVVMDIRLPGLDGLAALQVLQERYAQTPVIIITAFGNLETAVQAINRGAYEYLTKPFDLDDAVGVIQKALKSNRIEVKHIESSTGAAEPEPCLLGKSPAMQAVFRKVALVAEHDTPVLIIGESGTGKELVASAIHQYSGRTAGPFIPICVPAMSESLVESELFGHTKGAFTGATGERRGLLSQADQGTAFFDEIGDIDIGTQVKLLRALEMQAITPVGSEQAFKLDFRLVAATNQNLDVLIEQGRFREDLFYRLNAFRIDLPPLRERGEDMLLLAQHFVDRMGPQHRVTISQAAREELRSRHWHGNVRELRNAIEHAVIMTRTGEIQPEHLLPPITKNRSINSKKQQIITAVKAWLQQKLHSADQANDLTNLHEACLAEFEPILFQETLQLTNGNKQEAARMLGIHRQTLREKLKRYGIDDAN